MKEIEEQRVLDALRKLPGRDEDYCDTGRGYVGWGPCEDGMDRSRSLTHATWQDFLSAVQNPVRAIHDFYFELGGKTAPCTCCAASGKNREYADLEKGFYRTGSGPYRGWGEYLTQQEIDILDQKGRLWHKPEGVKPTPENLKKIMGPMGHDAINRYILAEARAKAMGIPLDDCYECLGKGEVRTDPARITLHAWTFDPEVGKSRCDTALEVRLDELDEVREFLNSAGWEEIKRRFGWAISDNMHPEIVYSDTWAMGDRPARLRGLPSIYGDDGAIGEWGDYVSDLGEVALNLIFDYRIVAPESARDPDFASTELPEEFGLILWLTYPRKGTDTVVAVRNARREDGPSIREHLRKSFEVHGKHFAWAAGRKFGNEEEREAEPETAGMSPFLPWG